MQTALDETDQRLLHALQIEPRASWRTVGAALDANPAALAQRWRRLRSEGIAWVTGVPRRGQQAIVEISCAPAGVERVTAELQRNPRVMTLDATSGDRDLLAVVSAEDLAALSESLLPEIRRLPGTISARIHLINEVLIDGSAWRLRALSPAEAARIPAPATPRSRAARRVPDDLRAAVEAELLHDGRATIGEIADRHGFAPQRVSDAIATLRSTGELSFRTDVARAYSGWPVSTWYFVEAPARVIDAARAAISRVPEVRLAVTSASRYNLILFVWLRTLTDVNRFEMALEKALEGSRIADRSVVLRLVQHLGRPIAADSSALTG